MSRHERAHSASHQRRSGALGRRLLTAASLGAALSGCAADRVVTGSTPPVDYRQRHPIVLAEGNEIGAHATMARIHAELVEAGVPAGYVAVSAYPVLDPLVAAPIRLTFTRLTASVTSPCGTWPARRPGRPPRRPIPRAGGPTTCPSP